MNEIKREEPAGHMEKEKEKAEYTLPAKCAFLLPVVFSASPRFYIRPFLLPFSFHPVHISDVKRTFSTADRTPRCNQ